MQRVVIVGAGAMGCLFGARLIEVGVDVTLVDVNREVVDAINHRGITWSDHLGARNVPAAATADARSIKSAELVIVFVKAMHTRSAVDAVSHLSNISCHALTLQNGIGNDDILAATFGADHTMLGTTDQPADLLAPGRVHAPGAGRVYLGGVTVAGWAVAETVSAIFNRAGISCQSLIDPRPKVWEKAAFNAALNVMSALCDATVGDLDCAEGRALSTAVAAEAVATARALNIDVSLSHILQQIDFAMVHHRRHKASMLQDLAAGRRTEIDAINGAIVVRARNQNVAVPVTEALLCLMKIAENVRISKQLNSDS